MKSPLSPACLLPAFVSLVLAVPALAEPAWESRRLHDTFYAEGAGFGDLDGDGSGDLVSGPFWWKGPGFEERHTIYDPAPFDVSRYSDSFFSYVHDLNGDGRNDVIVFGFPGKEARAYLNPGDAARSGVWPVKIIADQVSHESPAFVDLVPGGLPEIVCSRDQAYGYYEAGRDPVARWRWHPVSEKGAAVQPFGHGMGVGDVNGDGRLDIIDRYSWWENPAESKPDETWKTQKWALVPYGRGGAQIHVHDVDGDGLNDIVTSLDGHGYGLAWFRQKQGAKGARVFERHDIMGASSVENPYGVAFSQLHALELEDIDGDGLKDIITGKRWFAHGGKDPGAGQEAVLYWFRCERGEDGRISFVPWKIHDDSGVGVDVLVADLNGDARLDVVSASKKGLTVHIQKNAVAAAVAPEAWQVPGGRPDADYSESRSPRDAADSMQVPEGFSVDLIASEPDVVQPIAMCFDARGRIWVVEGKTYPQRRPEGDGQDRILILQDSDGDGSFETRKVFADNLNLVSGIEVGFGGVWVGAAPCLLFFPDADGDDLPDGEPRVLLDGWHYEDTHETLNSFTWGPDGWLYGCHGVFTHSLAGKPGAPDAERQPINAGIWRYHPTRHEFEVFAWGTSNPWGLDFNDEGDWFVEACVIPHFFHIIQGARYFRQAGQHFDPYIYDDIKTITDHVHYGDGTFASARADGKVDRELSKEKAADTSAVGGGHAHSGLAFYLDDVFPASYRGEVFFNNLHGHRLIREAIERDGSGYVARHRPDFALAKDHSFVGVGVMLGPDGALYVSDWHDSQTCHHRDVEIWDRSNGRIFRIRHGDLNPRPIDLPARSDAELAGLLRHENAFQARQAQRLLQERAAAGTLQTKAVTAELAGLMDESEPRKLRLRGLWARQVCGLLSRPQQIAMLDDSDPYLRGWAVQFLTEKAGAPLSPEALEHFVHLAAEDPSPVVRRYLASALQRLPHDQRWDLVAALAAHSADQKDRNLPLLTWFGFEPLAEKNPARSLALADSVAWPELKTFALRRASASPEGRSALLARMAQADGAKLFLSRGQEFLDAVEGIADLGSLEAWKAVRARGEKFQGDAIEEMMSKLGARLGEADAFPKWRAVLRDPAEVPERRALALHLLSQGRDPDLGDIAVLLLGDPHLRKEALDALPRYADEPIARKVAAALPDLPLQNRNQAINLLASRPATARIFLEAIDAGALDSSLVSLALLRQMRQLDDTRVGELLDSIWGVVNDTPPDLPRQMLRWKQALAPERLARANQGHGRQVFTMTCGTCHKLFGEGVALGPDLTGSNRADLDYLLENVLAPNAVVGKDYQLNVFTLSDNRVVSGMVVRENDESFTVAMAGGTELPVAKSEIAQRQILTQSLMPPGLFNAMEEKDVIDLAAYLASPRQAPLTGTALGSDLGASPAPAEPTVSADGRVVIEGEALLSSAQITAGNLRAQAMSRFGSTWSNDSQLWWTGAKPGNILTVDLPVPSEGRFDVLIYPTLARDYAIATFQVEGSDAMEVDLYDPKVISGEPVKLPSLSLSPHGDATLRVEIRGNHPDALERFMVGIDRIELIPVR